ncbi:hypothetical protein CRE_11774 [Caenorhabditis remanei]|uniref:RRM domain-containing protein n=1 Tax=Caenorhabditis remanei TaxID=31234 RepID=E3M4M2_CAERE|nr:hypothetical protein CRE_11774 [Caenorhabditis remanei]
MSTSAMRNQTLSSSRNLTKKTVPSTRSSSSTAKKSSESGWEYWTRVYSDDTQSSHDIRISDILSSNTLTRAKLLFLNVPNHRSIHKTTIMNLVKNEMIQDDISIQDVIFTPPGKWFLNFYRPEDALKVLKYYSGFSFRGHILAVRFCYPDGTFGDENALAELVKCSNNVKGKRFEQKEIVQNTISPECWSVSEYEELKKFETELMKLLKSHSHLPFQNVIQSMRTLFSFNIQSSTSSILISDALSQWPIGFIRIFNQNVKVISNVMCLSTSPFYTQRIHDSALEGRFPIHRNSWEPYIPNEIRSDAQLIQYFYSFLCHFGPQNIDIDIPIRILTQSLRGTWPKSTSILASKLIDVSSSFVIINRVLYLSNDRNHHEKVIDNIATYQDDCSDDYSLELSCDWDDQKVMIDDFDNL